MVLALLGATVGVGVFAVLAVVIAIIGIVMIARGSLMAGVLLLILAAAVGPGGWFIFRD